MKSLAWLLSRSGGVVMDFCAATCSTARACRLLDKHRKSVECDVDSELLANAERDLVCTFGFHRLNPKSDISGSRR